MTGAHKRFRRSQADATVRLDRERQQTVKGFFNGGERVSRESMGNCERRETWD